MVQTGVLLLLAAAPVTTLAQSGVQDDIEQLRKQGAEPDKVQAEYRPASSAL